MWRLDLTFKIVEEVIQTSSSSESLSLYLRKETNNIRNGMLRGVYKLALEQKKKGACYLFFIKAQSFLSASRLTDTN